MDKLEIDDELKGPTLNLALINIGMFVLTSIMSGTILGIQGKALSIFGLSYYYLIRGYFWTPITSIFTHADIAHIGSNLIFLFIYGFKLEEDGFTDKQIYYGYIITGVISGLLSFFFLTNSIQVGASGAVFGILGINYGIQARARNPNARKVLYVCIILFIMTSASENTNIFAHLIGLISGIFLGKSDYFAELGQIDNPDSLK